MPLLGFILVVSSGKSSSSDHGLRATLSFHDRLEILAHLHPDLQRQAVTASAASVLCQELLRSICSHRELSNWLKDRDLCILISKFYAMFYKV